MGKKSKISQYIKEYEWRDIAAMIKNNMRNPKICTDTFTDKLVVITGATSGIGRITARKYASMGANLLCVNRNPAKSEALQQEIESEFGVKCDYKIADLSLLADIHRVADELVNYPATIDVLIHNAGVFLTKKEVTADGLETVFVVHYLSSFIINYKLMDKLKAQDHARIILVNSEGHRFAIWGINVDDLNWEKRRYIGMKSYGSAKTAQILSSLVFEEKFMGSGVVINAMHPGAVKSKTGQENGRIYRWIKNNILEIGLKPADISAEALYYLGVSKEVETITGKFFNLTTLEVPTPPSQDMEVAYQLWEKSLELGGLESPTLSSN